MFRSCSRVGGALLWFVLLSACASTRPQDAPFPPPVLAKTVWDDASGRDAPADSLGMGLIKLLEHRDDMAVFANDSQAFPHRAPVSREGGGHRQGRRHGGGVELAGQGVYGSGVPERMRGEEHHASSLRLLLAGTVERWDVDSERTALDASVGTTAMDTASGGPIRLSVRLVGKATGRVAWKKTEDCPEVANLEPSDSAKTSVVGWSSRFDRCQEEILRSSARDVAQAALDLARKAAISEAEASADR